MFNESNQEWKMGLNHVLFTVTSLLLNPTAGTSCLLFLFSEALFVQGKNKLFGRDTDQSEISLQTPSQTLKVTQSLPIKLLAILFCPVTMVISAAPLPPNCTPSLATPGTAAKISAACWGERQSPVCTRRGTQQKSPNSCLLLPVDPANLLRFFAYNMLQQTHCPKRTELNWVAGLQITKQPHFNHGYSSAKECRK